MVDVVPLLITGGAGFIGVSLLDYLLDLEPKRYKITVADNLSTGNYQLLKRIIEAKGFEIEDCLSSSPGKVCFTNVDIRDREAITAVLAGQEHVVHLAAQTSVIPSLEDPFFDVSVNVLGLLNLLQASVEHKIGRFVMASSAAPLGEQEPPLDEQKIPAPLAPYGASKLAGEGYCSAYYGGYGLNTVVVRFSNVYGPNSYHKGSVVAHFMKQILQQRPLVVYGDGEQTRDYLYAGDIARAIDTILREDAPTVSGEIFQMGTGVETSVNRLVAMLKETTGSNPEVKYEPPRKGEIKRNYTSIEKIKKALNYQPRMDLKDGLKKTWEWFQGAML